MFVAEQGLQGGPWDEHGAIEPGSSAPGAIEPGSLAPAIPSPEPGTRYILRLPHEKRTQAMYAVIQDRGKQYTVKPGDRVRVDLMDAAEGADVVFDRVLLVGGDDTRIGAPVVDGAAVKATVLGEFKDRKIVVFKKKRRKKYRRKQGHRQRYTDLRVDSIEG